MDKIKYGYFCAERKRLYNICKFMTWTGHYICNDDEYEETIDKMLKKTDLESAWFKFTRGWKLAKNRQNYLFKKVSYDEFLDEIRRIKKIIPIDKRKKQLWEE